MRLEIGIHQQQRLEQWIVAMREAADIEDLREIIDQQAQRQSAAPSGLF